MSDRPIGIDLFAGAGGLSLGFEQAGFDIAAAVEIDPIHVSTHSFNFPLSVEIPKSVIGLAGDEVREAASIGSRRIDVVFGGAPCQGFSLIGQRALDDPRNALVREFVRLTAELDASYFVFENVKGLTVGRQRAFLTELIEEFEQIGYEMLLPWKVLDASSYGVPQQRERLILVGTKKGIKLPVYPKPETSRAGTENGELPPGPSCEEALADLPDAELFSELVKRDWVSTDNFGHPSPFASEMRCLTRGSWHHGYQRKWDPGLLTASMRTGHTDISRRRFSETVPGSTEPISRFYRLQANGVCNTLRAGTDSSRGAFTSPRPIHYEYARCVTVREMARLHGFPDWFRFHPTKWHGARQIGNAVPPPLARAVASEIVRAMGTKPFKPRRLLELGDPTVLGLDMFGASAYWGVPVPIGRRDRKSGAKKRKQEEIEAERAANLRGLKEEADDE